jgi:hypothetical protein
MPFGNAFSHFNNVTFVIWCLLLPIGISECPHDKGTVSARTNQVVTSAAFGWNIIWWCTARV